MRPNLFFVNFNRSGDCLFVFLRYIFLGLFSFLWLEFGHYNPSLKMCAIFRTLSFNYPLFNLKSNYDL